MACYKKALEINPQDSTAWYNKGNLHFALRKQEEDAIFCFDKALEIEPKLAAARNNKVIVLNSLRRYKEAIVEADKVLATDPENVRILYTKAIVQDGLGWKQDADKSYGECIALKPTDFERGLTWVIIG